MALATLFFLATCCLALSEPRRSLRDYLVDEEFLQWRNSYHQGKDVQWSSYRVWKKNAEFVRKQNSLGLSYSVAMNKFGHMTPAQLVRGKYLQLKQDDLEHASDSKQNIASLPDSVDWRKRWYVPPVCNEEQCATDACPMVYSIDIFEAIRTGMLVSYSKQEYIDCCTDCMGYILMEGCECIVKIGGLATEAAYPASNGTCRNNSHEGVKIHGCKMVQSGSEVALKAAVAMQPVMAAIDASQESFQFYKSGIYDDPHCSSTEVNHAVLIVGYGSKAGLDYWIIQNDWGTDWGMEGYALMSRNKDNQCGIATDAAYPY